MKWGDREGMSKYESDELWHFVNALDDEFIKIQVERRTSGNPN